VDALCARQQPVSAALAVIMALAAPVLPATAGSGNILYLVQDAGAVGVGNNSFSSDQSQATNSSISGPSATDLSLINGDSPAEQLGANNEASLFISNDPGTCVLSVSCAHIGLLQNNTAPGLLLGNSASAKVYGSGVATITQTGDDNHAGLTVMDNAEGSILQDGIGNNARLQVSSGIGAINQYNDNNSAGLAVAAPAGVSVTLNQNGGATYYGSFSNGALSTGTASPTISVTSNVPIVITQN
jgi:hypothetical protein